MGLSCYFFQYLSMYRMPPDLALCTECGTSGIGGSFEAAYSSDKYSQALPCCQYRPQTCHFAQKQFFLIFLTYIYTTDAHHITFYWHNLWAHSWPQAVTPAITGTRPIRKSWFHKNIENTPVTSRIQFETQNTKIFIYQMNGCKDIATWNTPPPYARRALLSNCGLNCTWAYMELTIDLNQSSIHSLEIYRLTMTSSCISSQPNIYIDALP